MFPPLPSVTNGEWQALGLVISVVLQSTYRPVFTASTRYVVNLKQHSLIDLHMLVNSFNKVQKRYRVYISNIGYW